jgi:hypothetical protein
MRCLSPWGSCQPAAGRDPASGGATLLATARDAGYNASGYCSITAALDGAARFGDNVLNRTITCPKRLLISRKDWRSCAPTLRPVGSRSRSWRACWLPPDADSQRPLRQDFQISVVAFVDAPATDPNCPGCDGDFGWRMPTIDNHPFGTMESRSWTPPTRRFPDSKELSVASSAAVHGSRGPSFTVTLVARQWLGTVSNSPAARSLTETISAGTVGGYYTTRLPGGRDQLRPSAELTPDPSSHEHAPAAANRAGGGGGVAG